MIDDDAAIEMRYAAVKSVLDERGRRRFAAAEAMTAGWGGIAAVSRITGIARHDWAWAGGIARHGAA